MRDLKKIYAECIDDLKVYGIDPPPHTPKLIVNTRAKKRWGQATYSLPPQISISSRLLDESVSDFGSRNTMMHEILHLCTRGEGHTGQWKVLANKVNAMSNGKYNVKRGSSAEEYGVPEETKSKYTFACNKCGAIVRRERASKFTQHPERYGHKGCTGKFRRIS